MNRTKNKRSKNYRRSKRTTRIKKVNRKTKRKSRRIKKKTNYRKKLRRQYKRQKGGFPFIRTGGAPRPPAPTGHRQATVRSAQQQIEDAYETQFGVHNLYDTPGAPRPRAPIAKPAPQTGRPAPARSAQQQIEDAYETQFGVHNLDTTPVSWSGDVHFMGNTAGSAVAGRYEGAVSSRPQPPIKYVSAAEPATGRKAQHRATWIAEKAKTAGLPVGTVIWYKNEDGWLVNAAVKRYENIGTPSNAVVWVAEGLSPNTEHVLGKTIEEAVQNANAANNEWGKWHKVVTEKATKVGMALGSMISTRVDGPATSVLARVTRYEHRGNPQNAAVVCEHRPGGMEMIAGRTIEEARELSDEIDDEEGYQ